MQTGIDFEHVELASCVRLLQAGYTCEVHPDGGVARWLRRFGWVGEPTSDGKLLRFVPSRASGWTVLEDGCFDVRRELDAVAADIARDALAYR